MNKDDMWGDAIALAGSGRFAALSDLQEELRKKFPGCHSVMCDPNDSKRLTYVKELIFKRKKYGYVSKSLREVNS